MTMTGEPTAIVPDKGIRPGFNETGTDIGANLFVAPTAGSDIDSIALPSAGGTAKGVSMSVIKTGYRGDVQVGGKAIVVASGTVARGERVKADTAGKALKATSGTYALGVCVNGGANGEKLEVELFAVPAVEP